jgi:hypothetical protein
MNPLIVRLILAIFMLQIVTISPAFAAKNKLIKCFQEFFYKKFKPNSHTKAEESTNHIQDRPSPIRPLTKYEKINLESQRRLKHFMEKLKKYKGNNKAARDTYRQEQAIKDLFDFISDYNFLPKNGVVHVPGSMGWKRIYEWAAFLFSRPDTRIVLSEVEPNLHIMHRMFTRLNELEKVWKRIQIENPQIIEESHIKTFEQFKDEISKRIHIVNGMQNRQMTKGDPLEIKPTTVTSDEVPKADVFLYNILKILKIISALKV